MNKIPNISASGSTRFVSVPEYMVIVTLGVVHGFDDFHAAFHFAEEYSRQHDTRCVLLSIFAGLVVYFEDGSRISDINIYLD